MVNVVPVDVAEERLRHHLLSVCRSAAQPLIGLACEQLLQDGDTVAGHVDRVEGLVSENGVVDFVLVLTTEGGLLQKHLVNQNTKCPPVDGPSVFLVQKNLSQVVSNIPPASISHYIPQGP